MGTEVLRPHDCLGPAPGLLPRRRTSPSPGHHPKPARKSPPAARPEARKRGEGSPRPTGSRGDRHPGEMKKREAEVYAGSAFWLSPAPSSLPLPSFFRKSDSGPTGPGIVDNSATMDLRRLLRLD